MKRLHLVVLGLLGMSSGVAFADMCMVAPTKMKIVSSRFGVNRPGGAKNHGGAKNPHMHAGLDFTTGGVYQPVVATSNGTVTWSGLKTGASGNTVHIKREGSSDTIVYYHLSQIKAKLHQVVKAGEVIGYSGRSGIPGGAIHLHFTYGVQDKNSARAKVFDQDAQKLKSFNLAQLPNSINSATYGWATDPSPYFCETFPFQNNSDKLFAILGKDTKAQYAKIFGGGAVPMGVDPATTPLSPVQVAAANTDALQAAGEFGATTSVASVYSDDDGFGVLPSPPIGGYDAMSPADMMAREARRRFADSEWNANVATVSSRALWVDYLRAIGVANYINEMTRLKKERVEALLALYTSQKLAHVKMSTTAAQQRVLSDEVKRQIK